MKFIGLVLVCVLCVAHASPIWPEPQASTSGSTLLTLFSSNFTIKTSSSSALLARGISRYYHLFFPHNTTHVKTSHLRSSTSLPGLYITVSSNDETLQIDTPEDYVLTIPSDGSSASLSSTTVYGALRGLESLSQLINYNFESYTYSINNAPWYIKDQPRFSHRGLLLDTSRHYEPISTVKGVIESLSFAKLNVLHWHMVDTNSFPIEMMSFPQLWQGAYSEEEKYTQDDVRDVIQFAKDRGIRIVVEFDLPGHAASWCAGYPDICPSPTCTQPLDPSSAQTWEVLNGILGEVTGGTQGAGLFPDNFIHLGGDEVDTSCWSNTPHVQQWLTNNNMTTNEAYMYFVEQAHQMVIPAGRNPVNWEEVFNNFGTALDKETIVQVWLDFDTLASIVAAGYRGILSNSDVWYLDHLDTTWQQFYLNEPFTKINDPTQQALVLGGEVCMWGETVDTSDVYSTVWPRAAAAAERLWSARNVNDTTAALPRLESFRCLLNRRGVPAAPTNNALARSAPGGPGACATQ